MVRKVAAIVILILAAGAIYFYATKEDAAPAGPLPEAVVKISSVEIPVELARTQAELEQGLSGRPSLEADKGMLFVFSRPGTYSFWMPDMHFPIDIIWINNDKVVDISADVSNEFDAEDPVFYRPSEPAQYVLEVNAGYAAEKEIKIGDEVALPVL
jgi:hypothetical protein